MCLITKEPTPKKTQTEIVCYKVLKKTIHWKESGFVYISPYQGTIYELGNRLIASFTEGKGINLPVHHKYKRFDLRCDKHLEKRLSDYKYEVFYGIHTFKNLSDAINDAKRGRNYENYVVVKCIIPVDVDYVEGVVNYGHETNGYDIIEGYVSASIDIGDVVYDTKQL